MHHRIAAYLLVIGFVLAGFLMPAAPTHAARPAQAAQPDDEIIYIDGSGFIRVFDPNVAPGTQAIQWVSPEGGWFDFATGDINDDGDMEIVAIGNGKLTIFDPVVQDGNIEPDGEFSFVPWKRLYEQAIPGGAASLVGAGDLDANVPGDEIIFGFSVNEANNINYRLQVLKTPDDGVTWQLHLDKGFGAAWTTLDVGNVNNVGSADVALSRKADSLFEVREIDNDFNRIFARDDSDLFEPTGAIIGQFYTDNPTGEVALMRTFSGAAQSPVLLIYQFLNNQWTINEEEEEGEGQDDTLNFFPHPTELFTADVNGNGDDELFWMRDAPADSGAIRLHMINRGADSLPAFDAVLDADNGYRVGAGGDVDADSRDEVVIMRNNRIRIYSTPESGNSGLFSEYTNISTNNRSLEVANLDGDGFEAGARIDVDKTSIPVTVQAGSSDNSVVVINVDNIGSGGSIPINVSKEGGAPWYSISLSSTTTPTDIVLTAFDASDLLPGTYNDRLVITSSADNVLNQPVYVDITLTVTAAPFAPSVDSIGLVSLPGESSEVTANFSVNGLAGVTYTAALLSRPAYDAAVRSLGERPQEGFLTEGNEVVLKSADGKEYRTEALSVPTGPAAVSWPSAFESISVSSVDGVLADTVTLRFDPELAPDSTVKGVLLLLGDERTGQKISSVNVLALTDAQQVFLPKISGAE